MIGLNEFRKADEPSPALVFPARYATVTACWYDKGKLEMYMKDHYPNDRRVVWCAQVPGMRAAP